MTLARVTLHGHTVAYRTAGAGPVLLLVHGMAGSSLAWAHVVPILARRFTVVAPDLLGHGDSAKPRTEYSVAAHANVLRDLLTVLGHERATLVGQSFGGGVVMQLAYQYPERCERLVLVSSGGLGREVHGLLRTLSLPGAEQVLRIATTSGVHDVGARLVRWLGELGAYPAAAAEEIARSYASLADADTRAAFFRTLRAVIDSGGQTVSAHDRLYLAGDVPTLIVWGGRDGLIPMAHGMAAHRAMPGSQLVVFEQAGHYPHCEEPHRFAETLEAFVETSHPVQVSTVRWEDRLRRSTSAATQSAGGAL
jgi:pimeloyl-ACP methyl ester carboxylesterase